MQGWGFVNLPSPLYHPYLVCILFGMPSLHPFTFLMFFKSCKFCNSRMFCIKRIRWPYTEVAPGECSFVTHRKFCHDTWECSVARHQTIYYVESSLAVSQSSHVVVLDSRLKSSSHFFNASYVTRFLLLPAPSCVHVFSSSLAQATKATQQQQTKLVRLNDQLASHDYWPCVFMVSHWNKTHEKWPMA